MQILSTVYNLLSNSSIARIILIIIISLGLGLTGGYLFGQQHEEKIQLAKQLKIQEDAANRYNQLQAAMQVATNQITSSADQKLKASEAKYQSLLDEFNHTSKNLQACKATQKQIEIIYKSANNTSKPVSNLTCADLGETLILHDKLYMQTAAQLNALIDIINNIMKQNYNH